MTPAARAAAAIDILDRCLSGQPAEAVLTNWARGNRFAGSGDRAAIRDLVFDALRCRESFAAWGGARTGRGLILGRCRAQGIDPETIFMGGRFAPAALDEAEQHGGAAPTGLAALDCPESLAPQLQQSLGSDFAAVMAAQQQRAPIFLRVNLHKTTREAAMQVLSRDGIGCQLHSLAKTALEVTENARKIQNSEAYKSGLVELQDASSQAMIEALPLRPGQRVLDYCAGGGGKVLAMAALSSGTYVAHDIDAGRMRDLPLRAARAGTPVTLVPPGQVAGQFDLVVVDAPCSGSGTWRRTPDAKWRLTPERLLELVRIQAQVIESASSFVLPGGFLAYMTCSLLRSENDDQADRFAARGWAEVRRERLTPLQGGDGFFLGLFRAPGVAH